MKIPDQIQSSEWVFPFEVQLHKHINNMLLANKNRQIDNKLRFKLLQHCKLFEAQGLKQNNFVETDFQASSLNTEASFKKTVPFYQIGSF